MGNDEILTLPEVAALLRIAEKTVYGLAQRGQVPAFKVGGQWRFSRDAIQTWIEHRTRAAQPDTNSPPFPTREKPPRERSTKTRRRR